MAEPKEVSEHMKADNLSLKKCSIVDDEDDDDIMLIEEETESVMNKEATINDINDHVKVIKEAVDQTQNEIKFLQKTLQMKDENLGKEMYEKLKYLIENPAYLVGIPVDRDGLQAMITDVVKEMFSSEIVDLSRHENQAVVARLNMIENSNHAVSKMFLECHSKLKAFGQSLAEESARVNQEILFYEKILAQRTINIDDDDEDDEDDDIKIVEDPSNTNNAAGSQTKNINQLRSEFASAVQSQMPGLLNTLNKQQEQAMSKVSNLTNPDNSTSALAALMAVNQTDKTFVWPKIEINDKVLGKKHSDMWYPGTVLSIQPPNPPQEKECYFKVRFNKGLRLLPGKHIAYKDSLKCVVRVGTRVTALYKEEDSPNTMFAGIIAEAPSMKNNKRFLVFFDDGYAQYCHASEVHKVYMQSDNVWEDIHPETRSFIKDYLDIYPERPMVRLAAGQVVKTEWNGKWWTAKVLDLDASLVKMVFQADRRTEWIYRGSTRLEPLFRALTNANAIKAAGSSRGRRLNLTMKPSDAHRKPAVEYTRGASIDDDLLASKTRATAGKTPNQAVKQVPDKKKMNVARKSTGGPTNTNSKSNSPLVPEKWEGPWLKYQRKASLQTTSPALSSQPAINQDTAKDASNSERVYSNRGSQNQASYENASGSKKGHDIASVLQERLASDEVEYDEQVETGKRRDITIETKGKVHSNFVPHACGPHCLGDLEEVLEDTSRMKGLNPLLVPLLCHWERQVCKARPNPKRYVVYRGPCGRRLRSIVEVDKYLQMTNSYLGIDLFSFDHNLHVSTEFVPIKTFCDIKDLSYGIENYPISCVNGVDRNYPDYVEYYNYRIPAKGVNLNLDPDFLSCCDCTDNCRDRSKCACQQLTIQNTSCIGPVDPDAGYNHRRLREPLFTGIYECNSRCPCDKRCHNKVAQLGLRMRLQVFRTEKKGWGLRCLDDIAKGSFICIYAGQLLTDKGANEDGKQYGDEYLAELDYMEVVESQKEGYESDVEFSEEDEEKSQAASKESEDSDFSSSAVINVGERRKSSRRNAKDKDKEKDAKNKPEKKKLETMSASVESPISISDEDEDNEDNLEATKKEVPNVIQDATKSEDSEVRRRAKKSTGGSRLNLSYSAVNKSSEPLADEKGKEKHKRIERLPTRSYFVDNTECYIMDAKSMGNLGRYLNHSCCPNVFVQNIFVDTHDLRFPWVSFFAGEYIRAGTELTWDYNYEVGSVPDKILYCYCGSSMCRGRLL